ncbi:restriction endonuclease subunit S [Acidipropionibacterium timonense]|uniref:restriction endonuclease subunit S n=1 Tax=Acidipropionibacterium timonense TaxID=2161818 RepID=UPI001FD93FF0|nr:restriction endonuclease subunit S [Acidipropionibacterium timonense]
MSNIVEPAHEAAPTVQLDNIASGDARLTSELTCAPPRGQNLFARGDVLFSKLRPYLSKSLLVDRPMNGSGEFLCLRPHGTLEARFLLYLTLSHAWLEHANQSSYGSKMPRTSWEAMSEFRLPNLNMETQRRIVDFLDDRVARIDQIIAARENQQRLADDAFRSGLESQFEASSHRPLKTLLTSVTSGPRGWGDLVADVGTPFVRIANLSPLGIELTESDWAKVVMPSDAEAKRASLSSGDVLLSITAVFGEVGVWRHGEGTFSQHVSRLRPVDPDDADWIAWFLQSPMAHDQYDQLAYGGTKASMGLEQVRNLSVPDVPRLKRRETRCRLASMWTAHQHGVVALQRQVSSLREYKQSLITAAVTGEFDVTTASTRIPE